MPDKNLGKRILSSKLLLIISLLILIFFTLNLTREILNRRDLQQEIKLLKDELDGLKGRNQELATLIEYFKTIDFVETEARTKLNLRKPGENIIIVPAEQSSAETLASAAEGQILITAEVKDISNFQRWWNYFFEINN